MTLYLIQPILHAFQFHYFSFFRALCLQRQVVSHLNPHHRPPEVINKDQLVLKQKSVHQSRSWLQDLGRRLEQLQVWWHLRLPQQCHHHYHPLDHLQYFRKMFLVEPWVQVFAALQVADRPQTDRFKIVQPRTGIYWGEKLVTIFFKTIYRI